MLKKLSCSLVLAILFLPFTAAGQTNRGSIRGTITDPSEARITGATVRVTNTATGEVRTTTTDNQGDYAVASLDPGAYRIDVEANGFSKLQVVDVVVEVNRESRIDGRMEVGQVTGGTEHRLDVGAPVLNQESASVATVIGNNQITNLPLDGRNFYELSLLVPGAVPPAQGSAGSVRGDFAFSVNGAREDSNNFLLDGVYNVDPKLNTFAVRPPVDAIHEFEIATSTYDAAFGRNPGAQVNVVLKSGSNDFHGALYEFHRNAALDARNFFAPANEPDPKYIRNQFGGSFGGPIKSDRTFFFADYEGTRSREGITRITNVPTLAERNGNFSSGRLGFPLVPGTAFPFPGGTLPFLHPVGQAIANLYPLPNRNGLFANFVSSPVQRDDNDHFDARVDHELTDNTSLIFRYSFGDRRYFEPFAGPTFAAVPGYGNEVPRRSQNALIGLTQVLSPAFVNDARFAYVRVASAVNQENQGTSINNAIGLPDPSGNARDFGLSFISIPGFSPLGHEGNNPQNTVTNTFQALDTASYVTGKHYFKFGADIRAVQQNGFRDVQARGFLNFSPFAYTGVALADLLLGLPLVTGVARVDNPQHLRTQSYHFFINDSYRLRPNLNLSLGLRYEYNTPPVDSTDRANLYDATTGTLLQVGTGNMPRAGFESDKNNFAPRVGLAWTIGEEGNTVVRAGYGVYYDTSPLAPGEALYFNRPYFDFSLFFPLPGLPLTLSDPFPAFFPFALPDSAQAIQRDLRTAYMQHWNVNVQQQLGRNRVLEVGYVGSKGTKLLSARDPNQPQPSVLPLGLPFVPRPNPAFDEINTIESRGNSNYHSLQARLQQRLSKGFSFLTSYTFSKSIDEGSNFFPSAGDPNYPQNSYDLRAERGRSNFDVRHRLSASYVYDLPFGRGKRFLADSGWSTLFSGWQTAGILTAQSGRPFTVALIREFDNSGTGISALGFGANDRPNLIGDPNSGPRTPERWFNTTAFAFPAPGTFGNAGRNIVEGPAFHTFNASLIKNTSLSERFNLQFRAEAFNLFNHPNLNLPDNFLGSPTFGQVTSARDPRHIQFGLKLLF